MSKDAGIHVMGTPAMLVYTDTLFKSKSYKNPTTGVEGLPKFGVTIAFEENSPDLAALKQKVAAVAKAKWPGRDFKGDPDNDLPALQFPFSNGTRKADAKKQKSGGDKDPMKWARGKILIQPSAKFAPRLAAIVNGAIVDLNSPELVEMHKGKFYNGVIGACELNCVAYESGKNHGVTIYLNSALSLAKGEKLSMGSASNPSETFKAYTGQMSAANPLHVADEISF